MSPRATITVTTVQEVKLATTVRRKVLTELRTYAELATQAAVLKQAMEKAKNTAHTLLKDAGHEKALEAGMEIDGFKAKLVKGSRKKLDKGILIQLGVTEEMLEEASPEVPTKPYVLITPPGTKEERDI